jgi:hypothetical protein
VPNSFEGNRAHFLCPLFLLIVALLGFTQLFQKRQAALCLFFKELCEYSGNVPKRRKGLNFKIK